MGRDPASIADTDRQTELFRQLVLDYVKVRNLPRREIGQPFWFPTEGSKPLDGLTNLRASVNLHAGLVEVVRTARPLVNGIAAEGVSSAVVDAAERMERHPQDRRKEL